MNKEQLEQTIYNMFIEYGGVEYTGSLDVIIDNGYQLKLYLDQSESPFTISTDGSENVFLNEVRKEISKNQIYRTNFYKTQMISEGDGYHLIVIDYD